MLRAIAQPLCARALNACRCLQVQLLQWLCDSSVTAIDVTQANLAGRVNTNIEADWLWDFLQSEVKQKSLLSRAQTIAEMNIVEKITLNAWIDVVITVVTQFQAGPPAWPNPKTDPNISREARKALNELLEAFYEKGLKGRNGLPYLPDGTTTADQGVTYSYFLEEFRDAHRANSNPDAREICVLCGGPLGLTPEVDHWIAKAGFPLLSVCGDNLLPVCGDCNSPANKGKKPVFSAEAVAFGGWFHPYLRSGYGTFQITYDVKRRAIVASAFTAEDTLRVRNLDGLLNLANRWTREFMAQYQELKNSVKQLIQRGRLADTALDLENYLRQEQDALVTSEPHYEVYAVLLSVMLEPARLAAWHVELDLELI